MKSTSFRPFLRYLVIVLVPILILLMMGAISIVINQTYVSRQIEPGRLESIREDDESIGLANTNRRLKLAYGERFGLSIDSVRGEGTVVLLELPAECASGSAGSPGGTPGSVS